jgi:hypothetical protein
MNFKVFNNIFVTFIKVRVVYVNFISNLHKKWDDCVSNFILKSKVLRGLRVGVCNESFVRSA